MSDRDVERSVNQQQFIATLRRLADALESGEPFRIQVVDKRFTVPTHAELSIEHEVEGSQEELELQLRWQTSSVS
jgi:amphi-Trp domain-containing protein